MALRAVALDDKYDLTVSRVYITGSQAVVRLMLMQQARDMEAGLNTAGFITGYRGSPVGGIDQQLWRAKSRLDPANIHFQPGLNEDLAATSLWGSQQAELQGEGRFDGVFGLWYGKGPGVDRSGDVFRHANHAGTSRHGGVLALMGDDHTCESSTSAHQSEFAFLDAMMPVLNPAGVQEILDFGLIGFALSRYAGCWVGLKCVKDNIESTASVEAGLGRVEIAEPADYQRPPDGLNIRRNDPPLAKEARLHDHKRAAIQAFVRANRLDRIVYSGGPAARIGIVSAGKSYLDVLQALGMLGIDEAGAEMLGLRLYKVGAVWPLEPEGLKRFAEGLDLIIVVEEKRSLIETQIREQLYGRVPAPTIIGKHDETGQDLFPAKGALEPNHIALEIAGRLPASDGAVGAAAAELKSFQTRSNHPPDAAIRTPWFCSGCPHNSSTKVPEGARAFAGIGCHYMALWMDRQTEGFTQMGGEGANWIGEAPFSTREHVFQNIGDGTYQHSGLLAIRAAIAAKVNITYKILFNDAVAMTGGQAIEGGLTVSQIARQLMAEGAERIVVLSEAPERFGRGESLPAGVPVQHRDYLDATQIELSKVKGVSVLIFDQTCAAEKRRRRKRGLMPEPSQRVVINPMVCEGCGDCTEQSNCVSVMPLETEFGRKRRIHQSSCNKDFRCIDGFCPSFVTVSGARLKRGTDRQIGAEADALFADLPQPVVPALERNFAMVITGVGGTGVVTVGALIGMAAHLEGKGCGLIDMAGLAQKGGAVVTHLRLAPEPDDIHAIRVGPGGADFVLGCDLVVAGGEKVTGTLRKGRSRAVINSFEAMTTEFMADPDTPFPGRLLAEAITERVGADAASFINAGKLAVRLMGDAIYANLFLLGYAWQMGALPLSEAAILRAIELNGVAVEMNKRAFAWGRRAAHQPQEVQRLAGGESREVASRDLDGLIAHRQQDLTAYQNPGLGRRFAERIAQIRSAEAALGGGRESLTRAAAESYHKVLAYKDEYEVARLFTDGRFAGSLKEQFDGAPQLTLWFAPPFLAQRDAQTGRLRKLKFGSWALYLLKVLARFKFLRGTWLDPFGRMEERRVERRLIREFEADLDTIAACLSEKTHAACCELAALPLGIRGFGPVKLKAAREAAEKRQELYARLKV
ncbi:MAG: indolepyruvate ferredoxin oxidoreductase [Hyphomicrobiales bacterium]|nr:MAG: indolepyruvate ferredoxin oxidoreductase [Hyphomicrobiales bacterium]